jgi:UDP-2,3-diacylglucosamine hydrolase
VAVYFASDMHLRLDRPERGQRLARWVDGLNPVEDALFLVGDVCDFWFVARERRVEPLRCQGLRALAAFRARGGELTIIPGNHDGWMGPFYEQVLGSRFVQEPYDVEAFGLRVHLVHGHRAGGRQPWKAAMESHAFLTAFENLPRPVARRLDRLLDRTNEHGREYDERRLIPLFRRYLTRLDGKADVAVFGHVHSPVDDPSTSPRLIVLGGWQRRSSYLRIDDRGAELVVVHDPEPVPV